MSDQTGSSKSLGDLAQEIVDRLVTDPEFKQMLLDRPAETLAETGYPVTGEVSGYAQVAAVEITTAISCPPGCNIGKVRPAALKASGPNLLGDPRDPSVVQKPEDYPRRR